MTWARFVAGFGHGARFISRMFPPNFAQDKLELLYSGMLESLQIAIIATVAGVLLSLPLGLMAARTMIALFRTFHPVIIAILFVKAVGFGALAGMLALVVASLGFLSKLVAEAVEEMSMPQVEAVRATGASGAQVTAYGVVPQVLPAFAGISVFRWDINIRESTVLGLVGAGGIGLPLNSAITALAWTRVSLILLVIVAAVVAGEWISAKVRHAII